MSDDEQEPTSWTDVDLGGHQRAALRADLRAKQLELRSANEDRTMQETQIEVLRRLQKEARQTARLEQRWRTVHRAHGELHVRTPRTRPHRGRVADGRGAAEPAAGEPVRQADRAEQRHLKVR